MAPNPQPVTQVRIFPYIPDSHIIVPPVFVSGAGTYAVGTLGMNVFYNLDMNSGEAQNGGPQAGSKYYAIGKTSEGKEFTTTWLTCLKGGPTPQFGRTITHGRRASTAAPTASDHAVSTASGFNEDIAISHQVHMEDVVINAYIHPTEPLMLPLIADGKGIASYVPHGSWSITVTGGERVNPLQVGMRVTAHGTNVATGKPFFIPAVLVTESTTEPAVFIEGYRPPREL
ncbi:hypothetical protein CXB49_05750 [Chromobacterium sp. ATCC 53434]|uniref:hypothetical protein n=1 Tax=Chromobacterium TaxID=535 RepID=UPI000C76A376|nr:hypothetical protein [Chromobacterium sp. ATCC 53434]AUH50347.1 hypothetical protein CXB49_05750 [Chromobacterium sp. ATCC 53434]